VLAALSITTIVLSITEFLVGIPWGFLAFFFGTGTLIYAGYTVSKMSYIKYDK